MVLRHPPIVTCDAVTGVTICLISWSLKRKNQYMGYLSCMSTSTFVAIEQVFTSGHQKNCRNHFLIQNISVTLSSVIIANLVCNPLLFNTIKVQLFANHQLCKK